MHEALGSVAEESLFRLGLTSAVYALRRRSPGLFNQPPQHEGVWCRGDITPCIPNTDMRCPDGLSSKSTCPGTH
jgi:hypothetical protein